MAMCLFLSIDAATKSNYCTGREPVSYCITNAWKKELLNCPGTILQCSVGSIVLDYAKLVMIIDGLSIENIKKRKRYQPNI